MAPQPSSLRTSFRALSITRIEIKESVIYTARESPGACHPWTVRAADAEDPAWLCRKRGIGSGDGRWMTPAPDELSILEKLREEIFQRLFTRFAAFRHAPQGRIAPPNFIHGPRQMLRESAL